MSVFNIDKLKDLKAEYGGLKRYAHPKMIPYTNKVHGPGWRKYYLLDLEKTISKLENMKNKLKEIDEADKKILFVATKKNLRGLISKFVEQTNHFFIDNRWLGGTLTNFSSIQKQIFLLQQMYGKENKGTINLLTKKEQFAFQKKKKLLERNLKGILEMNKLPDYIFIVDPQNHKIVWKEAKKLNIPILTMLKTNSNPEIFAEFVPINDGSPLVLEFVMEALVTNNLKKKTIVLKEEEQLIKKL